MENKIPATVVVEQIPTATFDDGSVWNYTVFIERNADIIFGGRGFESLRDAHMYADGLMAGLRIAGEQYPNRDFRPLV